MRSRSEVAAEKKSKSQETMTTATKVQCPACSLSLPAGTKECSRCGEEIKSNGATVARATEEPPTRELSLGDKSSSEPENVKPAKKDEDEELQENISDICLGLKKRGIEATLIVVSGMQPIDRRALAKWVADRSDVTPLAVLGRLGEAGGKFVAVTRELAFELAKNNILKPPGSDGRVKEDPKNGQKGSPAIPAVTNNQVIVPLNEVTYTFGEEIYNVAQYTSYKVGPFYAKSSVRAGETYEEALNRLADETHAFAAQERKRKAKGFLDSVIELRADIKRRKGGDDE